MVPTNVHRTEVFPAKIVLFQTYSWKQSMIIYLYLYLVWTHLSQLNCNIKDI